MTKNNKFSIIDIGSNTVRLVIYYISDSGFEELENVKAPIRLGRYLDANKWMSGEGIQALKDVLHSFKEILDSYDVGEVDCTATAAVRQASNREAVLKEIKEETGFHIRILSGKEEAYYGFMAVTQTVDLDCGLTIDIGGASTEITYFENRQLIESHSFPFGAVTLKEQFLKGSGMSEREQAEISSYIKDQFARFSWIQNKEGSIVSIGGSGRNLANVDQIKRKYPSLGVHGYKMPIETIAELRNELSNMSYEELEKVDGLSRERADLILPALEVFYQLLLHAQSKQMIVSSRGLRDGVIMEKLLKNKARTKLEVKEQGTNRLLHSYQTNEYSSQQMAMLAQQLIQQMKEKKVLHINKEDEFIVRQAALLFYVGEYISSSSKGLNTFYLLTNSIFDGYSHKEKVKISVVASFTNNSAFKQNIEPYRKWFTKEELQQMREWGALLKLCYSLNSTKRNVVKSVQLCQKNGTMELVALCNKNYLAEKYQSEKQKRHLEKALQLPIQLIFIRQ
ncbi:Ppx/GppA family phosphatase [Bacillus sp. REN10]|uniref:Ppx/GppA family phosphatase n=1 Tax=Bacillus sp. REN10 TaxID=2782541 RepID=UPI00193C2BFA|nr:Ppx/GppA family phosphatase [Bacillus sp. REN10]